MTTIRECDRCKTLCNDMRSHWVTCDAFNIAVDLCDVCFKQLDQLLKEFFVKRNIIGKEYLDLMVGWCVGNAGWKKKEKRK